MNQLILQQQFLLSSKEDLESLASKEKSRFLVISDSHGNFNVLYDIVEAFGSSCDALVFCGDGMEDLAILFEKAATDKKTLACLPSVIAFSRGNCDVQEYPVPNLNSIHPETKSLHCPFSTEFYASGRKILVTHGHKFSINSTTEHILNKASDSNADIVFYGHTHFPHCEELNGTLLLNPGSCSMPRVTEIPSFAIVEIPGVTERFDVEFFGIQTGPFGKNSFFRVNF